MRPVVAAIAAFGAAGLLVGGAQAGHVTKLTVAMHDPGCHWFFAGGKFTKTASVSGPVTVLNEDEATLKVAGAHGVQRIPVGKTLVVGVGRYTITMVGQAPDDNHLKLVVD